MAQLAEEAGDLTVVMHCFSLPQYVDECNARGYYASFAGNVTYKNAGDLRAAAARVREDRLLVETDAPFLARCPTAATATCRPGSCTPPPWSARCAAGTRRGSPRSRRPTRAASSACRKAADDGRTARQAAREGPARAPQARDGQAAGDRSRPPRPHALHRYGQNHLVDGNILRAIVEQAAVAPDDVVLEVGAADGQLTRPLLERARLVHAFEIDHRYASRLARLAAEHPNLRVHPGDALKQDLAALDPPPTALVANLAYNIAIPLIMTTIAELPQLSRWAVMVQKELGDRLFAVPSTKAYSAVSVLVQLACRREEVARRAAVRLSPAAARGFELRHVRRGAGAVSRRAVGSRGGRRSAAAHGGRVRGHGPARAPRLRPAPQGAHQHAGRRGARRRDAVARRRAARPRRARAEPGGAPGGARAAAVGGAGAGAGLACGRRDCGAAGMRTTSSRRGA